MTAALALKPIEALTYEAITDPFARRVLADKWAECGRADIAALMLDLLPRDTLQSPPKLRKRVDKLTEKERAQMAGWAEKWIAIGLSTEPADRPLFDAGVRACYRHSGLAEPKLVVWCPNPLVVALAGPIAHAILAQRENPDSAVDSAVRSAVRSAVDSAVRSAVRSAVDSAVGSAVGSAVRSAVGSAVRSAVDSAVGSAVGSAVRSAVGSAVRSAVDSAVDSAVGSAVRSAVRSAVDSAVGSAVRSAVHSAVETIANLSPQVFNQPGSEWYRYLGGQFWVGWYYWWGPAAAAFAIDVLRLDVGRDIELRARAFAACCMSACWFWPHSDFVLVSERPRRLEKNANGVLKVVEWDGWKVEP
jgi:phage baseplate assembly protein W